MAENKSPYQVIVLGAGPTGLGAIRGLAVHGLRIYLIAYGANEPSSLSRYPVARDALVEGTKEQKKEHLMRLFDEADPSAVVIPTSDWFVSMALEYQSKRPDRLRMSTPGKHIVDSLIDKLDETRILGDICTLPATVQELPATAAELQQKLRLPIIFKPRSFEHHKLGQKNIQVRTEQELERFYRDFQHALPSTIAQEIIPGDDDCLWVCNCTYNQQHELVGAFTFQRLKLSPPHYGVTSYAVSRRNEAVLDEAVKIGRRLGYVGTAMIEFKYDPRDQLYKYIELNPRLGMCNYFDTRCGVNNVYDVYRLACGEQLPAKTPTQREGVIFVSLFEDIYSRLKDRQPVGTIIRDYARDFFKPHVFIYFTVADPWPAFVLFFSNMGTLARGVGRKLFRR